MTALLGYGGNMRPVTQLPREGQAPVCLASVFWVGVWKGEPGTRRSGR